MCNFSQGFYDRGYDRGYDNGYDNGGINKQVKDIISLMKKLKLSFAEACDLLDIPNIEREKYHACITNDNNPADSDR